MEITIIIVVVTCVVSFVAFSNQAIMDKLIFYPPAVNNDKEWYRFFTCGLIHADIGHLAFNMIAFYYFGQIIEIYFKEIFHEMGNFMYVVLYISALAVCLLPTYSKQKENYHYRSLGASGAVSAIVFVGILLRPTDGIHFIFLPRNTAIPGLYLVLFILLLQRI
jgi:membrane associated rhomboid family serine protease